MQACVTGAGCFQAEDSIQERVLLASFLRAPAHDASYLSLRNGGRAGLCVAHMDSKLKIPSADF